MSVATATSQHYRLFVKFLGLTGVRFGEATALAVRDVHLSGGPKGVGYVNVRRAWKDLGQAPREPGDRRRRPRKRVIGTTKSRAGKRRIPIPEEIREELKRHVAGKRPEDFAFTNRYGKPIGRSGFRYRVWLPAREAIAETGKRPRVHDLRHSYASWAVNKERRPLTVVQKHLGHETITTTARYIHADEADWASMASVGPSSLVT